MNQCTKKWLRNNSRKFRKSFLFLLLETCLGPFFSFFHWDLFFLKSQWVEKFEGLMNSLFLVFNVSFTFCCSFSFTIFLENVVCYSQLSHNTLMHNIDVFRDSKWLEGAAWICAASALLDTYTIHRFVFPQAIGQIPH